MINYVSQIYLSIDILHGAYSLGDSIFFHWIWALKQLSGTLSSDQTSAAHYGPNRLLILMCNYCKNLIDTPE